MTALPILKRAFTLLALITAALLISPAFAQDTDTPNNGHGVVHLTLSADGGLINPLADQCSGEACQLLAGLLMPRLFDVDAATGALVGADQSDAALVQIIPPDLPSDTVMLALDRSRTWSDGEPVTAYDVLLSLMIYSQYISNPYYAGLQNMAGVRMIDDHTLELRFAATAAENADHSPNGEIPAATCDDLARVSTPIFPAHVLMPRYHAFFDQHAPQGKSPSLRAWWDALRDSRIAFADASNLTVTDGSYRWAGVQDGQNGVARFVPVASAGAALEISRYAAGIDYTRLSVGANELIAGDTNVLIDPPLDERATLRQLASGDKRNFQIAEPPGRESLIVLLNLANPARPLPAFHPETGEPLDQGQHPILNDVRVRRALQFALDQRQLIDGVLQQSTDRLAGLYPPSSWAFDPSLTPVTPNISEAKHLLDEAGWVEGQSGRHCDGCGTVEDGTPLQLELDTESDLFGIAAQIADQWERIGVHVTVGGDDSALILETFDAYLIRIGGNSYEDADPDRSHMLTPAGDTLDRSAPTHPLMNYGSYNNPDVTTLLERARTLPGCDPAARAELYHQVERILRDDVPFIPVAAPREFYAAAPDVIGFAPRTGDPLWNVESWTVAQVDTP